MHLPLPHELLCKHLLIKPSSLHLSTSIFSCILLQSLFKEFLLRRKMLFIIEPPKIQWSSQFQVYHSEVLERFMPSLEGHCGSLFSFKLFHYPFGLYDRWASSLFNMFSVWISNIYNLLTLRNFFAGNIVQMCGVIRKHVMALEVDLVAFCEVILPLVKEAELLQSKKSNYSLIVNKFWLFPFHVCVFFSIVYIDLCFFFSFQRLVLSPRSTIVPFFACKDFFPNPHVSLVLPSYTEP